MFCDCSVYINTRFIIISSRSSVRARLAAKTARSLARITATLLNMRRRVVASTMAFAADATSRTSIESSCARTSARRRGESARVARARPQQTLGAHQSQHRDEEKHPGQARRT